MGSRYAQLIASGQLGTDLELAGVADIDIGRAREAAGTDAAAYDSLDALLQGGSPDALYIATPDDAHRDPAVAAAEAGIPFLLEKPLATTVGDGEAIAEDVARNNVVAEVNFSNRWKPPFVAARASLGATGDFVTLFTRLNNAIGSPSERFASAGRTTPAWFLLSHCIDLTSWFHGLQAERVFASGVKQVLAARGIDTYDAIHAIVQYEGGTHANFETVWVLSDGMPAPVEFTFRYVDSNGTFTADTHEQLIRLATQERTTFPGTLNWAPQRFADFVAAVRG